MKKIYLSLIFAIFVVASACAQEQVQDSLQTTNICDSIAQETKPDTLTADSIKAVIEKANNGDAKAQVMVGHWLYNGNEFIDKNYDNALKYWALAAKQGNPQAVAAMALCYQFGHGARQDSTLAVGLYKKAIEMGNKNVIPTLEKMDEANKGLLPARILKECYQNGLGTEKNPEKLAYYLTKIAESGDIDSQYELAQLCLNTKKSEEAVKWFKKAADAGNVGAIYYKGWLTFKGQGTAQDKAEGIKLITQAADSNFIMAQYRMGQIYYDGDGIEKDYAKAVDYFTKAAHKNNADAKWMLGMCYLDGNGIDQSFYYAAQWLAEAANSHKKEIKQLVDDPKYATFADYINGLRLYYVAKDYESALNFFKKVEKAKNVEGTTMIGVCLANKDYAKRDMKKAIKSLTAAAATSPAAAYYLANIYDTGTGVAADKQKALELLQFAADKGIPYAQCYLADKYMTGDGVNKDLTQAAKLYLKAEAQNHLTEQAAKNLAECYRQQIHAIPDLKNAEARITQLNNLKENNNLLALLANAK